MQIRTLAVQAMEVGRMSRAISRVERVHVLGGHGRAHLGARLVIGLRLEAQGPAQDLAEDRDVVGGRQRLRARHRGRC